jgi:hypothetical protein
MAERRHCPICGKRAAQEVLQERGGLCWRCAHPGLVATFVLAAVTMVVVLIVILKYFKFH